VAGLFAIKDFQTLGIQTANPFLNVYGYRSNIAVVNEIDELLNAFIAQVLPKICDIQSNNMTHDRLEVYELNTPNFAVRTLTSGNVGTRIGSQDANFVAWGFRLNRATLGTRSGLKRIGAASDSDISAGSAVPSVVAPLNAMAAAYGAPLTVGIIETWFPVILHRPTGGSTVWSDSGSNGATYVNVTTQNTRKR
jgi:hypothetical protein